MQFVKSATRITTVLLASALGQPALAQFPVSQPLLSQPPVTEPAPDPDAWAVLPNSDQSSVQISKRAENGTTVFIGVCSARRAPGLTGSFARYGGGDLQTMDGESERVLFMVHGDDWKEAFAVQLRYAARTRSWQIVGHLAPVFVGSFARGRRLSVLNSQWREVFSFDLTGSSNAARMMRAVCGFE